MTGFPLQEILIAASYLLSIAAIGAICGKLFTRFLIPQLKKQGLLSSKIPLHRLKAPIILLFPVILYFVATHFYRPEALKTAPFIGVVQVMLIFAFAWLMTRVTHLIAHLLAMRFDMTVGDNLRARSVHTQITLIRRIVNFIIVLISLAAVFLMFGSLRGLGISLLTSAGVAGIIIGISAQKILGNLMAGIQLVLTQPIRLDDVVVIEGEWGKIEEITLTYIVVHIWDHRRLVIPISYFIEKPIQNWTRTSAELLRTVSFFVDYTVPLEPMRQKFKEILDQSSYWDRKVGVIQLVNCTPETVEMRALMSVPNAPAGWELSCEVREKMIEFIQSSHSSALPKRRADIAVNSR